MLRRRTASLCACAIALAAAWPGAAGARGYVRRNNNYNAAARQRIIQATQAQLAVARKAQAMAQAQIKEAQGKIDAANARIRGAKGDLDSAKSDQHNSHLSLVDIQAQLIEEAGPDSEIGKAHAAVLAAQAEFDEASKRVLGSEEYQAKAAAITSHVERLKRLPEIRTVAFEHDDDYQNKLTRLKIERTKFAQLRTEMVRNSPEWMAMSESVREALKAQSKAEATSGGLGRMGARYRLGDAEAVYSAATATANQCEFILRRLGVKPPPPPPSSSPGASSS